MSINAHAGKLNNLCYIVYWVQFPKGFKQNRLCKVLPETGLFTKALAIYTLNDVATVAIQLIKLLQPTIRC